MQIRHGMPNDLPRLVDIGEAMHGESAHYSAIPFDDKTAARTVASFLDPESQSRTAFVVTDDQDAPVGGVLTFLVPFYFSLGTYVSELALYLLPEARGGTTALRLIRHMERWGKHRGALQARVGVTAGINNPHATGIYSRLGYQPQGPILVKNL